MKTIGLLGGTGWSSTIDYYKKINELTHQRLGGYHSAKIVLKSIDYHDIMNNYGKNHEMIAQLLKHELEGLFALKPDCFMICCNSLHKYYDMIKDELAITIPQFHAINLVAQQCKKERYAKVILLATKFTMEDGFFASTLEMNGIEVIIPHQEERDAMQKIHGQLMHNTITQDAKNYFSNLIQKYSAADAVVLGCTEYPLIVSQENSTLPILNPVELQVAHAVDFAISLK